MDKFFNHFRYGLAFHHALPIVCWIVPCIAEIDKLFISISISIDRSRSPSISISSRSLSPVDLPYLVRLYSLSSLARLSPLSLSLMSTCESGGDPYPLSSHSLDPNPSEPDHQLPPDPLLDPGAFIDCDLDYTGPTLTTTGIKEAPNGLSDHHQHGAREPVGDESERLSRPATDASNCTETSATESTPPRGRRGAPPQAVPVELLPERPKWLPESWVMDCRIRTSGASAGSIDRYYFDPVSGRRFRSKKEVDYFLETGSTRKRKRDPDTNSLENSGGRKSSAPLNFEFNDVPENVRWVLTNASRDQWTPFVGDKMVPKSTRKEWNAAFHFSCS